MWSYHPAREDVTTHETANNSYRSVRVEHHSESSAHSSGRKIFGELSSNETVVAVSLDDLAPNSSEFSVVLNTLGLVNVSYPLAKVKACVLLFIDTLDLEEGELLVLSALASLEANEDCLGVESKNGSKITVRWYAYLTGCPFVCFSASLPIFI